jgi:integrase/recombinase XerD
MEKGDWPNYVDTIRPVYEPEELTAMFKAATEDEATCSSSSLAPASATRRSATSSKDLDFRNHDVRVTAKKNWGFTPKNWEERVVPLPSGLIERLRKRKERARQRRTISSSATVEANPTARWIWSSSASPNAPASTASSA